MKKKSWSETEKNGFELLMKHGKRPEDVFAEKVELLIGMKKFSQAEKMALEGLAKHPDSGALHAVLAKALMLQKKPEEAKKHIDHALALSPEDPFVYMDLSFYYLLKKDEQKSEEFVRKGLALDKGKHADWILMYAITLNYFGRYDKAIEVLKSHLKKDAASSHAWNYMGRAYINLNKMKPAKECFEQALKLSPDSDDALVGLAAVSFFRLDRKKTLEYAQDAWNLDKTNKEAQDFVKKASHFWLFYLSFLYTPVMMAINRSAWLERAGFEAENIEAYVIIYLLNIVAIIALHAISFALASFGLGLPALIVSWLLYPAYVFLGFAFIAFLFEYGKRFAGVKKEKFEIVVGALIVIYLWLWLLYLYGRIFLPTGFWLFEAIGAILFYLLFFWLFVLAIVLIGFLRLPREQKRKKGEPVFTAS